MRDMHVLATKSVCILFYLRMSFGTVAWFVEDGDGPWWRSGKPPTSEVGGSNPGPYVGKLIIAYRWSAVYYTEP